MYTHTYIYMKRGRESFEIFSNYFLYLYLNILKCRLGLLLHVHILLLCPNALNIMNT